MTADNCSHSVQSKGNPLFVNSSSSSLGPTIFCSESELRIFESRDTKKYCILNSLYISERWLHSNICITSTPIFTVLLTGPLIPEKVVEGLSWSHLHPRAGENLGRVVNVTIVPSAGLAENWLHCQDPQKVLHPDGGEGLCKAINFHSILPSAGRVHPLNVSSLDVFISWALCLSTLWCLEIYHADIFPI